MKGLVLSGGGAKGAYQVGVIMALEKLGYDYQSITGTSVGALNGAFVVQGELDELLRLWTELKISDVINGDASLLEKLINLDIKAQDFHQIIRSFKGIVEGSGLDITPFRKMLQDKLSEEKIRASSMDLGIVSVSLSDRKPIEVFKAAIPQGQLIDYLIASANLPVFNIERLEGKLFIDGGFYDNLPINLMASKGVRDMVAVDLGAIGITRKVVDGSLKIRTVAPSEDVGKLLEITPTKATRNLNMGYMDTLRVFEQFDGKFFYIKPQNIADQVYTHLWQLEPTSIDLETHFPIKGMEVKRALFEKIMPYYAELLKLGQAESYTAICVGILEEMASALEIERMQAYSYHVLAEKIEEKMKLKENELTPVNFYPLGWTSTLLTKKQRVLMLEMGWEIVKGVFLDEGISINL